MSERIAMRNGSVAAVVGGIMVVVGNILHPRESGQLDDAENLLEVVAAHLGAWMAAHVVIMTGIALFLAAFFGLTQSITGERATAWARLAWGVAIIGVGFGIAFMLTEAVAMSELGETWADSSGPEKALALASGDAIFQLSLTLSAGAVLFLFGATPVLFGAAMLNGDEYPHWLGWVGVIFGSVAVVAGVIQLFAGVTTFVGLVLVPIGVVVITLWVVTVGVLMWKRSG